MGHFKMVTKDFELKEPYFGKLNNLKPKVVVTGDSKKNWQILLLLGLLADYLDVIFIEQNLDLTQLGGGNHPLSKAFEEVGGITVLTNATITVVDWQMGLVKIRESSQSPLPESYHYLVLLPGAYDFKDNTPSCDQMDFPIEQVTVDALCLRLLLKFPENIPQHLALKKMENNELHLMEWNVLMAQ